jgi:hypothetical protein
MDDQHIEPSSDPTVPGSAEPLSPEQILARLRALQAWGVDLSLIRANLAQTPTQRLRELLGLLAVIHALRRSRSGLPAAPSPSAPAAADQEEVSG